MMDPKPRRTVLAFYGPDEAESARAYKSLEGTSGERLYRCGPPDDAEFAATEGWSKYSALRFDDECLIMARSEPAGVQHIVQTLQGTGSPAVFVLSDTTLLVKRDLPAAPMPAGDDFAPELAKKRGKSRPAKPNILLQLQLHERMLESARSVLAEAVRLDHVLTAAAEWLLDNGYLLRTQIAEIRRHLPSKYHQILQAGDSGDPYILELARALAAHTNYAVDEGSIEDCLRRYQEIAPLTIAELWSFPLVLRLALMEALTRLATRISRGQGLREAAYLWANRLAAGARRGGDAFQRVIGRMETESLALEPYFLTCVAEQLQDEEDALAPLRHWIETHLGQPLTDIVRTQHNAEAAEAVSTANAFGSLRALSRIEFAEVFESVSLVEGELLKDPGGIYQRTDFATRDRCRRTVERISRNSGGENWTWRAGRLRWRPRIRTRCRRTSPII